MRAGGSAVLARPWARALALLSALAMLAFPARSGTAEPSDDAPPGMRVGTGICEGGWETTGPGPKRCTHGTDDFGGIRPTSSRAGAFPQEPVVGSRIPCYKTGPFVRIMYVYGGTNKLDAPAPNGVRPLIREAVALADEMFYEAGKASGGYRRVRWRMNSSCKLVITPMKSNATWLFTVENQALERGKMKRSEHAVAFVNQYGCAGVGEAMDDERPGSINLHNRGPFIATVNLACLQNGSQVIPSAEVLAHELLHTLGAVQDGAPNSTRAFHCHDEWDVMCYQDGGPRDTIQKVCTPKMVPEQLDCRKNDYFNVTPRNGSYLDNHWNTARNVYLARGAPAKWDTLKGPTARIAGVTNGGTVAGTIALSSNPTAPSDAAIHRVEFFLGSTPIGTDYSAPYGVNVSTLNQPNDKKLTVYSVAYDLYQRFDVSSKPTVTIGNPRIHLDEPGDYQEVVDGDIPWSVTATAGAGRTVSQVRFYVDGAVTQTDTTAPFGGTFTLPGSPSPGSTYSVHARVTDNGGVVATSGTHLVVVTGPTVELLSPGPNESMSAAGPMLFVATAAAAPGSGTSIDQVTFYVDGFAVGTDSSGPSPYTYTYTPTGDEAFSFVTAVATDDAGGTAETYQFGPTIGAVTSSHSLSESIAGDPDPVAGSVTLTATESVGSNPFGADFFVDGELVGSDNDPSDGLDLSWNSATVGNGPHVLRARLYPDSFETIDSAGQIFTTANTQGTLAFTTPAAGSTIRGIKTLDANISSLPEGHTLESITYTVDGYYLTTEYPGDGAPLFYTTEIADGPVTLRAVASVTITSSFTQYQITATRNVTIRNTYATVTEPDAGEAVHGPFTLRATADADKDAAVEWVRFYIDGTFVGRDSTSPYAFEWKSGTVNLGSHTARARVVTTDGRWHDSSNVTFTRN